MFYRYIIPAVLTFVCISGCEESADVDSAYVEPECSDEKDLDEEIEHFQQMCKPNGKNESTLVLFDTTDVLKPEQIEYVLDNYVSGIKLEDEGDVLTIAKLDSKPVQVMEKISICAPKPMKDFDWWLHNKKKMQYEVKRFQDTAYCSVKKITKKMKEENQSFLIEAIIEVFRNKAYKLKNATNRKLILVSDLYQHSALLSFEPKSKKPRGICGMRTDGQIKCLSLTESLKNNRRSKNYLRKICGEKKGSLVFLPEDSMEIYYLVQRNRIDGSAEPWWTEFLVKHCGLERDNLKIVPELQK